MNDEVMKGLPLSYNYGNVDPGFSQWNLNVSDVIEQIDHDLRGDVWDSDKKKWDRHKEHYKLTEDGLREILRKVNMVVNKVTITSNIPEDIVRTWLWDLSTWLSYQLFMNVKKWGVNFSDLWAIYEAVMLPVEAAMRRAVEDGERKKIYEGTRTSETRLITGEEKRGGLFSFIPGMGGKK